jgi:site-specific DNA-methyltransferase (adenine-specific)
MSPPAIKTASTNTLFYGDNLEILQNHKHFRDECVDLIYLDPPFNSNADYNILFREQSGEPAQGQIKAFTDTWKWSELAFRNFTESCANQRLVELINGYVHTLGRNEMTAYLVMMSPRLVELHRVLKNSGTLFLHCDPTASHYLKTLLDAVFGPTNFLNEIVWRRTGSHNSPRRFGPVHDIILFFAKGDGYNFKTSYRPYTKGHVKSYFKQEDANGRYWTNSITGAGLRHGESGQKWKGYDPSAKGRHWAIPGKIIEELGINEKLGVLAKLDALDEAGSIDHPVSKDSLPTYRQYLKTSPGMPLQDLWTYQPHTRGVLEGSDEAIDEDVRWLVSQGDPERLGYPTQKPVGLMKRIIASACPPNGIVFDPFCGCGTTIEAAHHLKRKWVGIDITHLAIALIKYRLSDALKLKEGKNYHVVGEPSTTAEAEALAAQDRNEFQRWALSKVPRAFPFQDKKGADSGVDGIVRFNDDPRVEPKKCVIQVKSGLLKLGEFRDFAHVIHREKATLGLFICLQEPTEKMQQEADAMGFYTTPLGKKKIPIFQIRTIGQLLAGENFQVPENAVAIGVKRAADKTAAAEEQSDLNGF